MSWISENKVPAAIIGVSLAGVIGLGVVLYSTYTSYDERMQEFDTANHGVQALKSAPLAPTKANLEAKAALVSSYASQVNKLSTVLHALQVPDTPTTSTDFQSKLKSKIAEVRQLAADHRVAIPGDFNLGFQKYVAELPKSNDVATQLSTYLDAVDGLVRLMIDSGVISIDILERSDLASESDAPPAPKPQPKASGKKAKAAGRGPVATAPKITEARQVRVYLTTDQAALQMVLSKLASPGETKAAGIPYFPIVRLVRIENERKDGPPMVAGEAAPTPPPVPAPEGAPAAAQPAAPDSVVILGNERLRAYLEIDLVKFLEQQTAAATR